MRLERTTQRLTALAQEQIATVLRRGSVAVDATAGNGHDTVFLRRQVGSEGRVYCFDIQSVALDATHQLLLDSFPEMPENVELLQKCHSQLGSHVRQFEKSGVNAVMFNLGYLPGGDHNMTTSTDTTGAAIRQACQLLVPGGLLSVMVYTGQKGGRAELKLVQDLAEAEYLAGPPNSEVVLDWMLFESVHAPDRAPKLFIARKT